MPRFFAVAASVAICRLVQLVSRLPRATHACGVNPDNRSRWLLTPCALRLGGPHLTSQPLTPSVAPWVLPRDLRSRVRRTGSRLSSGVATPHVARTPDDATRLKETPSMSPGCLPSVRSRSCDRAKPSAFPVTFARKSSHPFARSARTHPVQVRRRSVLLRAVLVCLAAPFDGAEKMPLSDLCNRLTIRAPVDRSISGRAACAALTAGCIPDPRAGFSRASPDHLAAIQPRLGTRLTARLQLRSVRTRRSFAFRLTSSGQSLAGDATSAWLFRPCARLTSDL